MIYWIRSSIEQRENYPTDSSLREQIRKTVFLTKGVRNIIFKLKKKYTFFRKYLNLWTILSCFRRLDYCGIALLIMGSFVPWLYYGFYCHYQPKVIYLSVVCVLGCLSIIVSLFDKFSEPNLRPLRAGVFASFGLSGIVPAIHYSLMEGWFSQISQATLGWLILMGCLYIIGAMFYALRVPERWFPGKFDLWVSAGAWDTWISNKLFVRFTGTITSNFPYICNCSSFCTLPWYLGDGHVQSNRRRMWSTSSTHRFLSTKVTYLSSQHFAANITFILYKLFRLLKNLVNFNLFLFLIICDTFFFV